MNQPQSRANDDPKWAVVDGFLASHVAPADAVLTAALEANARAGLPAIDVSPVIGKLLHVLVRAIGAAKILEIGTLGGYSTICLARAVGAAGKVVTLEVEPAHAAVARANFERAGLTDRIELRLGRAADTLPCLEVEQCGPFDLIFIDADKPSNADYVKWALRLSRPGTLIVVDNVVRRGAVADAASTDANVQGARKLLEYLAVEPRLNATALQTVGVKGHDGLVVAVVN
jgi:predicted O-methyltransferase YrrM